MINHRCNRGPFLGKEKDMKRIGMGVVMALFLFGCAESEDSIRKSGPSPCSTHADCDALPCIAAFCDQATGFCRPRPAGVNCAQGAVGVCDGEGTCVECVANDQCEDGDPCTVGVCVNNGCQAAVADTTDDSCEGSGSSCMTSEDCDAAPFDCVVAVCAGEECVADIRSDNAFCHVNPETQFGECLAGNCYECVEGGEDYCPTPSACQTSVCLDLTCATENLPDGQACVLPTEDSGICDAGTCIPPVPGPVTVTYPLACVWGQNAAPYATQKYVESEMDVTVTLANTPIEGEPIGGTLEGVWTPRNTTSVKYNNWVSLFENDAGITGAGTSTGMTILDAGGLVFENLASDWSGSVWLPPELRKQWVSPKNASSSTLFTLRPLEDVTFAFDVADGASTLTFGMVGDVGDYGNGLGPESAVQGETTFMRHDFPTAPHYNNPIFEVYIHCAAGHWTENEQGDLDRPFVPMPEEDQIQFEVYTR